MAEIRAEAASPRAFGLAAAVWGFVGVAALLLRAIWRLFPVALEGIRAGLPGWGWLVAAGWVGAMAYFEGYRGFQRGFAPRVVSRAAELARAPRLLHALLAPLYCMSLFAAARRRMIVSWSVVVTILALVLAVPWLAQPWRGVIDAGVVVGLAWGLAALVILGAGALFQGTATATR